jgi:cell wall-associated NlpC family hydrolase
MQKLDPRLHAYREDLADERLKDKVEASHWVKGTLAQINVLVTALHKLPDQTSRQLTQALFGEACNVFEAKNGWAWIQLQNDGYVGYVRENVLSKPHHAATHRVANVSTWRFPSPDLKSQPAAQLYFNSQVSVERREGNYALLHEGGALFAPHLRVIADHEHDFVVVAERYLHVPYYWGGKTCAGIDCSGLLQISLHACGILAPRDSDLQENALGILINDDKNLRRGDLIFWPGHVGIMQSATQLLHANGHFMKVTSEPLTDVVARSEKPINSVRRFENYRPIPAAK